MRAFYCGAQLILSMFEEYERKDFINDTPKVCDACEQVILIGAETSELTNVDEYTKIVAPVEYGEKLYLHRECANRSCWSHGQYLDLIRARYYD